MGGRPPRGTARRIFRTFHTREAGVVDYYDTVHGGYATCEAVCQASNGRRVRSDVWRIALRRDVGGHLAPFPDELVARVLALACPEQVCSACGEPRRRVVRRTTELDPARPQARRAMELASAVGLTEEHIFAIQATGISDAGKAMKTHEWHGQERRTRSRTGRRGKGVAWRLLSGVRRSRSPSGATVGWTRCSTATPAFGPALFSTLSWGEQEQHFVPLRRQVEAPWVLTFAWTTVSDPSHVASRPDCAV